MTQQSTPGATRRPAGRRIRPSRSHRRPPSPPRLPRRRLRRLAALRRPRSHRRPSSRRPLRARIGPRPGRPCCWSAPWSRSAASPSPSAGSPRLRPQPHRPASAAGAPGPAARLRWRPGTGAGRRRRLAAGRLWPWRRRWREHHRHGGVDRCDLDPGQAEHRQHGDPQPGQQRDLPDRDRRHGSRRDARRDRRDRPGPGRRRKRPDGQRQPASERWRLRWRLGAEPSAPSRSSSDGGIVPPCTSLSSRTIRDSAACSGACSATIATSSSWPGPPKRRPSCSSPRPPSTP